MGEYSDFEFQTFSGIFFEIFSLTHSKVNDEIFFFFAEMSSNISTWNFTFETIFGEYLADIYKTYLAISHFYNCNGLQGTLEKINFLKAVSH